MDSEEIKKVPYIIYEAERHRSRQIIKVLAILLAAAVSLGVISNLCWKTAYDKATKDENRIEEVKTVLP